mgnify:CR=1 FL=1
MPTVALALGSGGARGYAHIGAIQELEARGYEITSIAGTSMGAMVGGLYATGNLEEFADWIVNVYTPTRKNANMSYTICQWPDHMTLYNIPLERRQQIAKNIREKI